MKKVLGLLGCGAAMLVCVIPAAALEPPAAFAYGMDRTSTLYTFNPATGAATAVGPLGIGPVTGSSFGPGGLLYTDPGGGGGSPKPNSGCLYTVNTTTGAATQVGCDPNQGGKDPIKFAFGPDGILYGARLACNAPPKDCHMYLCRVNTTTGALTDIGDITKSEWCEGYGMAFGADGNLYQYDACVGMTIVSTTDASRTVLGGSFIGFPGKGYIPDMGLDPTTGTLWAIVAPEGGGGPNYTGTVNTTTGDVTYVATLPGTIQTIDFQGQASIPALGGWGIILLVALVGMAGAYLIVRRG